MSEISSNHTQNLTKTIPSTEGVNAEKNKPTSVFPQHCHQLSIIVTLTQNFQKTLLFLSIISLVINPFPSAPLNTESITAQAKHVISSHIRSLRSDDQPCVSAAPPSLRSCIIPPFKPAYPHRGGAEWTNQSTLQRFISLMAFRSSSFHVRIKSPFGYLIASIALHTDV